MGDSGLKHFEGNLEQLKKITDNIERGDLPLAELMSQFKAGLKLLNNANRRYSKLKWKLSN